MLGNDLRKFILVDKLFDYNYVLRGILSILSGSDVSLKGKLLVYCFTSSTEVWMDAGKKDLDLGECYIFAYLGVLKLELN